MPTSGHGENSAGRTYDWSIEGFGQLRGGRWYSDRAPADETILAHKTDPNWGMVVEVRYPDGTTRHFTIIGGYDPDVLPDIIDLMIEDYG